MKPGAQEYVCVYACLLQLFVCVYSASASVVIPGGHRLERALHHFEVLQSSHLKHRGVTSHSRELHLTTLGRDFKMLLFPRKRLFEQHIDVRVVRGGTERKHAINFDRFYTGRLKDDVSSSISAHLDMQAGELTASISSGNEKYFIEPSHRHFRQSHDFRMISYRASDLKYNLTGDPSRHFCGNDAHQTSGIKHLHNSASPHFEKTSEGRPLPQGERLLLKRQTSGNVCPLHLVATHQFHQLYSRDGSVDSTILFMVQVIDDIDRSIFQNTAWDSLTDLGFSIRSIKVYEEASSSPTYNRDISWRSGTLLEEFSHSDWSGICLAHLFTAVSLTDRRLGVAYVASSDLGTTGGICSSFIPNFNGFDTTANVGMSSFLNEDRQLLLAEARLVTAHELGHNWGSEHDPTDSVGVCNPNLSSRGGKFLMFPSAQDGSKLNNDVFSPCSRGMVAGVLQAKAACFTASVEEQCGDYEVESGEECDAGLLGQLGNDPCCNSSCKLTEGALCSDINDICCEDCGYAPPTVVCRSFPGGNRDCLDAVNCTGDAKDCPSVTNFVAVGTECGLGGRGICRPRSECPQNDSCPGEELRCRSFCEQAGLTDCFCQDENECFYCCNQSVAAGGNSNKTCRLFERTPLPTGTTCLGGRCDDAGSCEPTTQDLVNRLFNLFTDLSANNIARFLGENIVGAIVVLTLLVWVPGGVLVHCLIDRKIWKTHKETSEEIEKQKLMADIQDARDYQRHDQLTADTPGVIDPHCKRGLLRTDSLHGDFFDGHHLYLGTPSPLSSPMKGARKLSAIAEELHPERHNILAHVRNSVPDSIEFPQ